MKKLIIDILRPASFDAAFIRLVAFSVLLSFSCNSVKRVLNDEGKTAKVVDKYLQTHPFPTDTVNQFLPGKTDTTTQLLFSYDTTMLHDTVQVTKIETRYKTVTKVDTLVKTIVDNSLLQACQARLMTSDYDKKQAVIDQQAAKQKAKQWQFYFFITIGVIMLLVLLYIFFGRK